MNDLFASIHQHRVDTNDALDAGERVEDDAYYTADQDALLCVNALPAWMPEPNSMLEPSVGAGAFVRAARVRWPRILVSAVDINPNAPGMLTGVDWKQSVDFMHLDPSRVSRSGIIIGNPPFAHAEEHVRYALYCEPFLVGFLLRIAFLESIQRRHLWMEHPPAFVHVLSRRPSFSGGGTDKGQAYAFFVWIRDWTDHPRLGWI